jgi:hypothetical protein
VFCDDREESGFKLIQFLRPKLQVAALPKHNPSSIHTGAIANFVLWNTSGCSKLPKFRICHFPPPKPRPAQSSIAARFSADAVNTASGLNKHEKSR